MPFVETALIGDDAGEGLLHFGLVRLRINGTGNLLMEFIGLDNVATQSLKPLVMSETPGYELTRLANFKNQRARLKLSTDVINESVKVNRIIIFAKEIYASLPQ